MTGSAAPLDRARADSRLATLLARLCERLGGAEAVAAVRLDGETQVASHAADPRADAALLARLWNVSCIAKTFTAILVLQALAEGRLGLDAPVRDHFGPAGAAAFGEVTVTQLMNHTHGLDGYLDVDAPVDAGGLIATDLLLTVLAQARPVFAPGAGYTYGNLGYMILGAVLERVYGQPYEALLNARVMRPLGLSPVSPAPGFSALCPAGGRPMPVSARDLVCYAEHQNRARRGVVDADLHCDLARLRDLARPLPGWSPLDQGFALGWACGADGWFGQSGRGPGHETAVLKFNPRTDAAMVLLTRHPQAFAMSHHLLEKVLGVRGVRVDMPRLLSAPEAAALDLGACEGRFENGRMVLIVRAQNGQLGCAGYERLPGGEADRVRFVGKRRLVPAADDSWLVDPPGMLQPQFLRFLRHGPGTAVTHLWEGGVTFERRG